MSYESDFNLDLVLSNQDVLNMLFDDKATEFDEMNYTDSFGNYIYYTDLVTNTPNIAMGTSSDFDFMKLSNI